MNAKLQDSLKRQVLQLERSEVRNREHKQQLESACESLTENLDVARPELAAVLRNLQDEQASPSKRPLPFSISKCNPIHTRIAIYCFAGFLAFSAYKSAQIEEIQQESRYDYRTNNFKVAFNSDVGMFKSILGAAQLRYHKTYGHFPNTLHDLNLYYDRTTRTLAAYAFVKEYNILNDGSVRIQLTEDYGYNRWLKLSPHMKIETSSHRIVLECTSNAEPNLLSFNHASWCSYTGG